MATDVDTFAIKEQIVDILDSDTALFDATGAGGKVRKITAGAPRMEKIARETTIPQIWVTNDNIIDDIRRKNVVQANAPKTLEHTMHFRIILIDDAKDGPKTEEKLDDFVKLINETITENYDLRDPGGAEGTSVVDNCTVIQVTELSPSLAGKDRSGRVIRLRAVVTTG